MPPTWQPRLELVITTNDPTFQNLTKFSHILVNPAGDLLFVQPMADSVLQIRKLDGAIIRFARRGDGPHELRDPLPLQFSDSTVIVEDRANLRLSQWSASGDFLTERRLTTLFAPVVVPTGDDRFVVSLPTRPPRVLLLDAASGSASAFVPTTDSFLDTHWGDPAAAAGNPPAIGPWNDGVALGDRMNYEIGLYDWAGQLMNVIALRPGRNLPTQLGRSNQIRTQSRSSVPIGARQAERRAAQPLPWFSRMIHRDDFGRMWLVGETHDSAYADLYAGAQAPGRIWIPCRSIGPNWDLEGNWLAVICAPDDPDSPDDAVVKLFRTTEPGPKHRRDPADE